MNQDFEHLRLLSIFHYVVAGLALLFALFPIIHLFLGIAMVTGLIEPSSEEPPPRFVGWILIAVAVVWMLFGSAFAACLAVAGRYLSQRRHHTYCLVMAAISCAFMPFGTVLGVFTIIVLSRQSVRLLFGKPLTGGRPAVT